MQTSPFLSGQNSSRFLPVTSMNSSWCVWPASSGASPPALPCAPPAARAQRTCWNQFGSVHMRSNANMRRCFRVKFFRKCARLALNYFATNNSRQKNVPRSTRFSMRKFSQCSLLLPLILHTRSHTSVGCHSTLLSSFAIQLLATNSSHASKCRHSFHAL